MVRLRIARALFLAFLPFCALTGCGGGGGGADGGNGDGGGGGTGTGGIPIFWYKYGGDDTVFGHSVKNTADNGFVLAGSTTSAGSTIWSGLLVKTDSLGSLQWQKVLGGTDNALANAVVPTPDGGFVVAGGRGFNGASRGDFYLAKVGPSGVLVWERTHDRNLWEGGYLDVRLARTGGAVDGYVLTGGAATGVPNQVALYIQRTDLAGNELWENVAPVPAHGGFDSGRSVIQARDGGFVVAGAYAEYSDDNAAYLVKFAPNGAFLWERRFAPGIAYGVIQAPAPDNGYVVVGAVPDGKGKGQTDLLLLKTDETGSEVKRRTFGGAGLDAGLSVARMPDNGYIIAGRTESYSPPPLDPAQTFLCSDVYLVRTDANLDPLWIRVKGNATPTGDAAESVEAAPDGGFIVGGGSGLKGLLAKFDSLGLNVNLGSKDLTLSPAVNPGVIGFASAKDTVGAGLAMIDLARNTTDAAMAVLVDAVDGPPSTFCAGGGSHADNLTPGPLAAGSVLTVDFDDCVTSAGPDNVTLNGTLVLTIVSFTGNLNAGFSIGADLSLDNVTASDAAGTNRIDGIFSFRRDASGGTVTDNVFSGPSGYLSFVEQSPSRTIGLTGFSCSYLSAPGPLFAAGPASGTLDTTGLSESVTLTIGEATRLQGPAPDIPSSGTVRVEASDGSTAEATARPPDEALIAVDEDGDGTFDGTMTILWELLY